MIRICLLILTSFPLLFGQLYQRERIQFGGALGFLGTHYLIKPSFDVFYKKLDLSLAPDLFYGTIGLRYKFGKYSYCNKGTYHFPSLYLAYSYNYAWLKKFRDPVLFREDLSKVRFHTFIIGLHKDLDYRGIIFIEGGLGILYTRRFFDNFQYWKRDFYPYGELRVGGIIQTHKVRQQRMKKMPARELPIIEDSTEHISKKELRQKRKEEKQKLRELEKQYRLEVKEERKKEKARDKEEQKRFREQLKEEKRKLKEQAKKKKQKKKKRKNKEAPPETEQETPSP